MLCKKHITGYVAPPLTIFGSGIAISFRVVAVEAATGTPLIVIRMAHVSCSLKTQQLSLLDPRQTLQRG